MIINKDTAISTSKVLLVPYEAHHVPTYHTWMKDEDLRAVTASEPLSLEEEYTMQTTWRTDPDKLTFIVCLPLPPLISITSATPLSSPRLNSPPAPKNEPLHDSPPKVLSGTHDEPSKLIGDINLFLSPTEAADHEEENESEKQEERDEVTGEISLMIAPTSSRRKGYGRATLLAFIMYIQTHTQQILHEYNSHQNPPVSTSPSFLSPPQINLKAKIQSSNTESIALFRSIGFLPLRKGKENFWGEVEFGLGVECAGGFGYGRVGGEIAVGGRGVEAGERDAMGGGEVEVEENESEKELKYPKFTGKSIDVDYEELEYWRG